MSTNSDDPNFDKLLAELEKKGEEPKPIIEKQIKKNRDEQDYEYTVKDNETEKTEDIPEDDYHD